MRELNMGHDISNMEVICDLNNSSFGKIVEVKV